MSQESKKQTPSAVKEVVTAQPGPVVEDPASVTEGPTIPVVDLNEAGSSGNAMSQPFSLAHVFCGVFLFSQHGTEHNPLP